MKTYSVSRSQSGVRGPAHRGSVLITALIFAIIIGITLVGYIKLSTNSLKLAHRTFFADAANNLAEAGTEEAVWSFNRLGNATDPASIAAAWQTPGSAWTLGNTVADAYVDSCGSNYTSAPTVTITGGGGTGAIATATVATSYVTIAGVLTPVVGVASINITNPGTGYTTSPTLTLTGGGGTGASATARLSATRTFDFPNLDQGASGTVKVWVAGYNGSAVVPFVVAKATITPIDGAPVEKTVKIILTKNGALAKGVVALDSGGINWNGRPLANSYISSPNGLPPYALYNAGTARANTTVASLTGTLDLSNGTVAGNVMGGPGVAITGGTVTGQTIGNFSYPFVMPTYPINLGATSGVSLGATIPATLPRAADVTARTAAIAAGTATAAAPYYYYTNGATIGAVNITSGTNVVIVGTNTSMTGGLMVLQAAATVSPVAPATCGKATIYIDGPVAIGNSDVNTTSWAGALEVYTTTSADCVVSGNGSFYGCLTAPYSQLRCNGGGNNDTDLCGSFVLGSITDNGHMKFHFDEGLTPTPNPKAWTLALWTEMQTSAERAQYASQLNF